MAAVEVFAEEYAAAALMPAGARRKALFAIKGAMIDLSSWLNSAAQEGGVVHRAKAANDNDGYRDYVCLVAVRRVGRLLIDVSPDASRRLRYISLFSGIEACSAALERVGADCDR